MFTKKITQILSVGFFCLIFTNNGYTQFEIDYPFKTKIDGAGNIYVTGEIYNSQNGTYDILIRKIAQNQGGSIEKKFESPYGDDKGYSIDFDGDGNIYITGSIYNNNTSSNDIIVLKYNSSGNLIFSDIVQSSLDDKGISITYIPGNGFAICGYISYSSTDKNFYIRKYSNTNQFEWEDEYGSGTLTNDDIATHLIFDNYFIYVGGYSYTNSTYKNDLMMIAYDYDGNFQEELILNNTSDDKLNAFKIIEYSNNPVRKSRRVGARTSDNSQGITGNFDIITYYIDFQSSSYVKWIEIFGETNNKDIATDVAIDSEKNIIVTGYSYRGTNKHDFTTIKYGTEHSQDDAPLWYDHYDSDGDDKASSVSIDQNDYIYITGFSSSSSTEYLTLIYNPNGSFDSFLRVKNKFTPVLRNINLNKFEKYTFGAFDSLGNFQLMGFAFDDSLNIITGQKYNSEGVVLNTLTPHYMIKKGKKKKLELIGSNIITNNYPNPFNPTTKINFDIYEDGIVEIDIFDISGRIIESLMNKKLTKGNYKVTWDASGYSSGTYFYRIKVNDKAITKKIMLLK